MTRSTITLSSIMEAINTAEREGRHNGPWTAVEVTTELGLNQFYSTDVYKKLRQLQDQGHIKRITQYPSMGKTVCWEIAKEEIRSC